MKMKSDFLSYHLGSSWYDYLNFLDDLSLLDDIDVDDIYAF